MVNTKYPRTSELIYIRDKAQVLGSIPGETTYLRAYPRQVMPTAISSFFSIIFESDLTPKGTSEYTNEEFIISYNKLTKQMNLGIENKVEENRDSTMNNNAVGSQAIHA